MVADSVTRNKILIPSVKREGKIFWGWNCRIFLKKKIWRNLFWRFRISGIRSRKCASDLRWRRTWNGSDKSNQREGNFQFVFRNFRFKLFEFFEFGVEFRISLVINHVKFSDPKTKGIRRRRWSSLNPGLSELKVIYFTTSFSSFQNDLLPFYKKKFRKKENWIRVKTFYLINCVKIYRNYGLDFF